MEVFCFLSHKGGRYMKQENKTTTAVIAFLAVILLMMPLAVLAGSLEPSGPPTAGTMHSLEDIYQKLSTIEGRLTAIEGKLQTPTTSTTTTAPAGRFQDNGNGTVTDTATGLIWLKLADPGYPQSWATATYITSIMASGMAGTGLTDGSVAGQWRLPTKVELEQLGTDPPITAYAGWWDGQATVTWTMPGAPFTGVHPNYYWACANEYCNGDAWCLNMLDGYTKKSDPGDAVHYFLPVRTWELPVP
jgi:hypothetical protein